MLIRLTPKDWSLLYFSTKYKKIIKFILSRQQLKKAAVMDSAFIKQTLKNYYLKTNGFGLINAEFIMAAFFNCCLVEKNNLFTKTLFLVHKH